MGRITALFFFVGLIALTALSAPAYAQFTFQAITGPSAAETVPFGISNAGTIVGEYCVGTDTLTEYAFVDTRGVFTTQNVCAIAQQQYSFQTLDDPLGVQGT